MSTLLHISDLHRTAGPRVRNDELLAAIISDAGRWEQEGIPRPDLIVLSGDVIQGARADTPDADSEVASQYEEAADFLDRLAREFVEGDRYRVVMVPGNHDVNWARARAAMHPTAVIDRLAQKSFEANSGFRWDWQTQQAYEIADQGVYDSRCQQFRDFRRGFYAGVNPDPLAQGDDIALFDYSNLGLVVLGFSSWHGNDCFCHVGDIDTDLLAQSQGLLAGSDQPIAIAVWHHGIVGGPRTNDYMDQLVIQRMIDFGFSLGLHGHQHYPNAAPYELRLPNLTSMVVVGAGSLAVGDRDLPMGERRQLNVIVIDEDREEVTIHVRAMSPAGVFTASHRDDFGGASYISLPLPHSPTRPRSASTLKKLDEAMTSVRRHAYEEALTLVSDIGWEFGAQRRQVEIEAFAGLGRTDELLALLNPPQTTEELVRAIAILLEAERYDVAMEWLEANSSLGDAALYRDLQEKIKGEMRGKS